MEAEKPGHVTKGNVLDDLGLTSERSAVEKLKFQVHENILKIVEKKRLTPREIERIIDKQQPRVSELLRGKIAGISLDMLVKYAEKLGAEMELKLKVASK